MADQRDTAIQRFWGLALKKQAETGIAAPIFLSILGTESTWGNTPGNAFFGVQGINGTAGQVNLQTAQGPRPFAAYNTPEEAFDGFVQVVKNPRYAAAWSQRNNPAAFFAGLQVGGYAGNGSPEDRAWSNLQTNVVQDVQRRVQNLGLSTATTGGGSAPAGGPALPRGQNGWAMPVAGSITSLFGEPYQMDGPRSFQGRPYSHFNAGIDVGGNVAGQTVVSMTPGKVVAAGPNAEGWGYVVRVQDPDGFIHNYGHVDAAQVQIGQFVQPGTPLAKVYAGGARNGELSTGPHLSYDIWDSNRAPVDPTPWLTQNGSTGSAVHPSVANDPAKSAPVSYLQVKRLPNTGTVGLADPARGGASMPQSDTPTTNKLLDDLLESSAKDLDASRKAQADYRAKLADPAISKTRPVIDKASGRLGDSDYDIAKAGLDAEQTRYNSLLGNYISLSKLRGGPETDDPLAVEKESRERYNALASNQLAAYNANRSTFATNASLPIEYSNAGATQTQARSQLLNANTTQAGQAADIITAIANTVTATFGEKVEAAKFFDQVVTNSFNRSYQSALMDLQRGELTMNAFSARVTADASKLAATAARSLQNLNEAKYVSDENWQRAQRLLPAGVEYLPGQGPNDERAQALRGLGITPTVTKSVPLPADWNDPWANLRKGDEELSARGYGRPQDVMADSAAGLARTAQRFETQWSQPFEAQYPAGFQPANIPSLTGAQQTAETGLNMAAGQYQQQLTKWLQSTSYDTTPSGPPAGMPAGFGSFTLPDSPDEAERKRQEALRRGASNVGPTPNGRNVPGQPLPLADGGQVGGDWIPASYWYGGRVA